MERINSIIKIQSQLQGWQNNSYSSSKNKKKNEENSFEKILKQKY